MPKPAEDKDRIMMKKSIAIIIGALIMGVCFAGCTKKGLPNPNEPGNYTSEIFSDSSELNSELPSGNTDERTTADIYKSIQENVALPEMYVADDDYIMNYYGIDTSKLEDYTFASCTDPTRTDSVILMKLKDEADTDEIKDSLNLLLEQMGAEMENYNPAANELVKKASVRVNGNMIVLVICEDIDKALSITEGTSN